MLAQLIQALYNIVDSFFVGKYSDSGLTALSIIYPVQLLMIALAVGTGVGINTVMAAKLGTGERKEADEYAGVGTPLAIALWLLFAAVCWVIMPAYARMSTSSEAVIRDVVAYGRIVCVFSFGLFLESIWTKILQSGGDMKTPMLAQIIGTVTNIALDPLLIFGMLGLPELGISGAAVATVAGQIAAALIVMKKGYHRSPARERYLRALGKLILTIYASDVVIVFVFYAATIVLVAQVYGVELSVGALLTIIVSTVLVAMGCPGVPGGAIIMTTILLTNMGLPLELVGPIAGIFRLIDMADTTFNCTGDVVTTLVVARSENMFVKEAK